MDRNKFHILFGSNDDIYGPNESIGKYLLDCLKRRGHKDTINIDAITGKILTCGKLLDESIKTTAVLKNLGLAKGDVFAICSENHLNYCVPILGALYMGVTVNLLNPAYATRELRHALNISRPKLVLCSENALKNVLIVKQEIGFIETVLLMGNKPEKSQEIKHFEDLLETIEADVTNFVPETFDCSEQEAFILLSSGTTGLPKGVLLTHQNFKAPLSYIPHPKFGNTTPEDTTVLVLPLFHMFGVVIQLVAIASSMKLVLLNKFKPDEFLRAIQQHQATKLFLVPPLLLFLVKSPLVDNYDTSSIRDIIVGAAPVGEQLEKEAAKRLSEVTIRQLYGLTEAGGACTFQKPNMKKTGCIGELIPKMAAKVWDPNLKKNLGPLEVGELCFKGPMIMKGYLRSTVATEECIDQEGFLHSGDLGYYDQDGYFYIVGRVKEIIKYKGFQVPPAELEALILTHLGVKDCGVIGIPDEKAGEVPRAYVVRQKGTNVTEKEIVDYVAERISVQKRLYGGVAFIDEIPKNPSGKILRRILWKIANSSSIYEKNCKL